MLLFPACQLVKSQAKGQSERGLSHAKKVVISLTFAQSGQPVICSRNMTSHQIFYIPLNSIINLMDLHNIKGPQDYHKFYHTSSEGLVWLDGKGNQIPLSHMLGTHVEAIDPTDLWNLIQTRNKVHKHNFPVHGHGPTNSTTIDSNTPLMTTLPSPIMEHHVEVSQLEVSSMVTVKNLLEDPQIQPSIM